MSQAATAERAGLHRTEIGFIEGGKRVLRLDTIVKLAGAVEVEPCVLLEGGITEDREGWRAPDGRRTTAVDDAFVWALKRIAQGADGRRRRR